MKAYITAAGKFLPGKPVANDEMEDYLGRINGKDSVIKNRMLRQNGIQTRYYALDKNQKAYNSVAGMIAKAIENCLTYTNIHKNELDFLATATSQGDLPVPGLASMVHAELGNNPLEIASLHGVCGSSLIALKDAWLQILAGNKKNAVVGAGEFASRMFKSSRFNGTHTLPLEVEFLRWMLSDGAGAVLLQNKPSTKQLSLEVNWIDIRSYASLFDVCMYAGVNKTREGYLEQFWMDYDSFTDADRDGAIFLKQDARLVSNIVKLGVQRFFELIDEGKINPKSIDRLLCHYSSHHFKKDILDLLEKGGLEIPEQKWFTNLYTKGNTGSASIFVMLEELLNTGNLKAGEQILCMVPESGRFLTSFMMLTVVAPEQKITENEVAQPYFTEIQVPHFDIQTGNQTQEWLVRQLTNVWVEFETGLNKVPVVDKINRGMLSVEEYKLLLLNLRQQVIDGSQWIARAASNVSIEYFDVRSSFISHSRDEHRDYQILEKNFINLGGTPEELKKGEKNIGSEALSSFMFQRASLPNPFDLLGGMFIIEGLGNRLAGKWGRAIQQQLNLDKDQVSFLIYHETSDSNDNHFERFEKAIQSELLTLDIAKRIVKTAKVVAKLYTMQLEELGNY
jgi:3-oxoacyl-[acyl-carrier-protein] synthase-3